MEMMLVLAIIAMLIAVGAVTLRSVRVNGEIVAAQAQLVSLKAAMLQYRTLNREWPRDLESLVNPPAASVSKNPFVAPEGILDPWGQKYQLRVPGKKNPKGYDLYTMGPDGIDGTTDEIYAAKE